MTLFVFLALLTGALVATSTTINAATGKHIGVMPGTLVNYIGGLLVTIIVVAVAGGFSLQNLGSVPWYGLLGGLLGAVIVSITNVVLPHIPVVYTTVILFTGQVFIGILIDWGTTGIAPSAGKLFGFLLVLAGLFCNAQIEKRENKQTK